MPVVCELPVVQAIHSRRGAVFTGLSVQTPWAQETASGRSVVRLALGLFDVWDPQVQDAILLDMRKRPKWANVTSLPAAFGSLLASAGGRPRDIESIVMCNIDKVNHDVLLPLLSSPILGSEDVVFLLAAVAAQCPVSCARWYQSDAVWARCHVARTLQL
jgi:hypothetical protein